MKHPMVPLHPEARLLNSASGNCCSTFPLLSVSRSNEGLLSLSADSKYISPLTGTHSSASTMEKHRAGARTLFSE